jgi:hypothetical protein
LAEQRRNLLWCPGHCYLISCARSLSLWYLPGPSLGVSFIKVAVVLCMLGVGQVGACALFRHPTPPACCLGLSRPTLNKQLPPSTANPGIVPRQRPKDCVCRKTTESSRSET